MWSELIAANPGVAYFFGAWLALCVGSFLNVVIYRLPIMMNRESRAIASEIMAEPEPQEGPYTRSEDGQFNLSQPRSRCPNCGHAISALQNVPVLSWLWLRGKCGGCGNKISARYPMVEALTGILSIIMLTQFGFTWLGFAALVATWMLISMAFIDYDTMLLPDQLTLPFLWLGLLVNLYTGITTLESAVWGAIVGYLLLWSIYWIFKLLTKKEGMGYGDFKLLAALGAWLGWQALPAIVLVSSVAGVVYAIFAGLLAKGSRDTPMPFGPFLAIAGWVCLWQRDTLLGWYGFY